MRLATLLEGFAPAPRRNPELRGMTQDSRSVEPGEVFVALAGARHHGLDFLAQAVERGCAAVIWEPAPGMRQERLGAYPELPAVAVPHLRVNLGRMASRFYGHPSRAMDVVGVTGTNGKSSFVHLLARAVDRALPAATLGTVGAGRVGRLRPLAHTTPDAVTVQRELAALRDAGARFVAMEVSSHALDQERVAGVAFRGAAWTNLSRDHLDYHGSMERYAAAKARLFALQGLQFAILNADDPALPTFRAALRPETRCIDYGIRSGTVRAGDLRYRRTGVDFLLQTPAGERLVQSPMLGSFNVYNQLAVAATLLALGWRLDDVAAALAAGEAPPGRMDMLRRPGQPLVVIDYAHTPDALSQCLQALRQHGGERVICVFGCGGERDAGKRPEMGAVAERLADQLVITDDNPRGEDGDRIVRDILAGLQRPEAAWVERDRARAIGLAIRAGGPGDVVLLAGKGHETYQEAGGRRRDFDDRRVAAAALEGAA